MRRRERRAAALAADVAASAWLSEIGQALDDRVVTLRDEVEVDPADAAVAADLTDAVDRRTCTPARPQGSTRAKRPLRAAGAA
ncbi:MAG: hypothetical protein JWO37_1167 [Acidimicrobiales bacterium]|jgi:hypothetical protein|nr:hypothetical protein [Acidimicrobiales bacterium]